MDDLDPDTICADGLLVPWGWAPVAQPPPDVLAALSPTQPPGSGPCPSLVLTRTPRAAYAGPLAQLAGCDPVVEDQDDYETDLGQAHYLRVAWSDPGVEMLAEIWWWHVSGDVLTLTARMARTDFADYTEVVEEVAETFLPAA